MNRWLFKVRARVGAFVKFSCFIFIYLFKENCTYPLSWDFEITLLFLIVFNCISLFKMNYIHMWFIYQMTLTWCSFKLYLWEAKPVSFSFDLLSKWAFGSFLGLNKWNLLCWAFFFLIFMNVDINYAFTKFLSNNIFFNLRLKSYSKHI